VTSDLTADSRFLSYVLRHNPGAVGAVLDEAGWADIDALLSAAALHGHPIGRDALGEILAAPGKQRFEIRHGKIRAIQGHSVPVELGLHPAQPPELLYHGTVGRFLTRIRARGLQPQSRNHVHLSADPQTARAVGARRGVPVILVIRALAMHRDGGEFYQAANGIWLTAQVPPQWIADDTSPPP
jgi:putative RNA 2'-phosphotransferase